MRRRSGHLADRLLERGAVGAQLGEVEADALEEDAGARVGVLVGVEDVGAVAVEQLRERRDDAALVRARDQQRGGAGRIGHGAPVSHILRSPTARCARLRSNVIRERVSPRRAPPLAASQKEGPESGLRPFRGYGNRALGAVALGTICVPNHAEMIDSAWR